MTTKSNKAHILAELWLNYRDDEEFLDFVEYNDLGLPLAYMVSNSIVDTNPRAEQFIEETFGLLLSGMGIEDQDYETLDEILDVGLGMGDE
jgi:hypothetical protein